MKHSPTSKIRGQAVEAAIVDTALFIDRNASSLCEILELWSDADGIDTLLDAIAICDTPFPDRVALAAAMNKMHSILASITTGQINDGCSSGLGPIDPFAAVAWHGARISDLSRRLKSNFSR